MDQTDISQTQSLKSILQNFAYANPIELNLGNFIINILIATFLCVLIQFFYFKFSKSFSNKFEFSKNFVLLGITTTIIITIVKSSLALSLGLVGALSIVRFRAAIKEPEELVYLFLIIAVGIGIGAGQVKITIFGIILALIILSAYHYISKKKIFLNTDKEQLNLGISVNDSLKDNQIDDILNLVKNNCSFIKFVSMSRTSDHTTINLDINLKDQTNLSKLSGQLNDKYKNTKVIISSNYDLAV